ncbi:MAG: Wzz/FepE/Etk N-terminal domain-containing protein [Lachnospiraceae bacterium]|nr:Wzz/FepE/Etk N-terminal domain-containing protein [Lachnospiraceae bacterium]
MEPIQQKRENGLDLMQIAGVLLSRFWIIVFSGILVGVCALIFTKMTTTPTYTSSTKMYILSKGQSASDVTSSDLQLSAVLASDYAQLIKDRTVTESVIAELGLSMSSEALASRISVDMPGAGRIITISVTDTDPYMASKLATTVRDTAALHIKEVMNSEAVNVVEEANIPQGQTMFNYKRNGMAGVVLGMAIAIGIIMLQYMMNDTIKNPEDVERYLGLSVLGSIPIMKEESRKEKRRKEKHRKKAKGSREE